MTRPSAAELAQMALRLARLEDLERIAAARLARLEAAQGLAAIGSPVLATGRVAQALGCSKGYARKLGVHERLVLDPNASRLAFDVVRLRAFVAARRPHRLMALDEVLAAVGGRSV